MIKEFRVFDVIRHEYVTNIEDYVVSGTGVLYELDYEESEFGDPYILNTEKYIVEYFTTYLDIEHTKIYDGDLLLDYVYNVDTGWERVLRTIDEVTIWRLNSTVVDGNVHEV